MPGDTKPQPHVPPETRGKHKTIAVVAAEWHLRALVRAAIESKRTRVMEAASLRDLRDVSGGSHLDLVILDAGVALGGQTASDVHAERYPTLADTPLLLLTDSTPPDDAPNAIAFQPDRTLHKHFSPFELLNVVYALAGY